MKTKELQGLSVEELHKRLDEISKELMKARTQFATGSSQVKPAKLREMKKDIARIHTVLGGKAQST